MPIISFASTQTNTKEQLTTIMDQYGHKDGVEAVKIGRMALAALRGAARIGASGDKEAKEAIRFMNAIKSVNILEFDSCSKALQNEIEKKVTAMLKYSELLIEASDGSDKMKIYGTMSESNNTVSDLILYTPSDHAVICLIGMFSVDDLNQLKKVKK